MSLFSLLFLFYDLGWIWIIESMLLEEFYDSWDSSILNEFFFFLQPKETMIFYKLRIS